MKLQRREIGQVSWLQYRSPGAPEKVLALGAKIEAWLATDEGKAELRRTCGDDGNLRTVRIFVGPVLNGVGVSEEREVYELTPRQSIAMYERQKRDAEKLARARYLDSPEGKAFVAAKRARELAYRKAKRAELRAKGRDLPPKPPARSRDMPPGRRQPKVERVRKPQG